MDIIVNLIILAFILCFIIDQSGAIDSIKHFIGKQLNIKNVQLLPAECSLCMIFWIGIIYLAITSNLTLYYLLFVCVLAFSSRLINYCYEIFYNLVEKILTILNEIIEKM